MFKTLAIQLVQEESDDLIQMINPEQESDLKPEDLPEELSILPIKNTVLFPGVVIPITVGRQKSIKLVKKAYQGNRIIGVIAQKNSQAEEPAVDDLYRTVAVRFSVVCSVCSVYSRGFAFACPRNTRNKS